MLEIKNITKIYKIGDFTQRALDNVSINFRKSEFVSILGPSGSGKTTLLNIIGGLDKYTSGDLLINEVSTKNYKDKDWDTYRNHKIGFVFQSYNLIGHQTILSNVELALTLSGVSKQKRRKKAETVLESVGLKAHMHKKPNQMSGGQMQRVAIARALINDPDILLADEPTGALDTETSKQIMELLKEISKNKLVIMVTHNPNLAHDYSTRIVELKDGIIESDSNEYDGKNTVKDESRKKKTNMKFSTALSLSLNNLMTKKGRTILTAFAGSIGIIGISLILSISSGVQTYINNVQEDTLTSYPLTIQKESVDFSSMLTIMTGNKNKDEHSLDKVYSNDIMIDMISSISSGVTTNNLKKFKDYVQNNSEIKKHLNDVKYIYNINLQIYSNNTKEGIVKLNPSEIMNNFSINNNSETKSLTTMGSDVFVELSDNKNLLNNQYDVISGKMPENYDEVVLIVDKNNEISDYALYSTGFKDQNDLKSIMGTIMNGQKVNENDRMEINYNDIINKTFKLVINTDIYKKVNNNWVDMSKDYNYMKDIINKSEDLKIVGIIKPNENSTIKTTGGIGYTSLLTEYVINNINKSEIVKEQKNHEDINIFTGNKFGISESINLNYYNMGCVDEDNPDAINLYPKDFDSKEKLQEIIKKYNNKQDEKDKIEYTDYVGILMGSVTTIVNVISYVLIAFVSISLIVSSIMIGIITYISVLERTKEIGILRAIGASKKDISRVFNAETVIIGFISGLLGIGVTELLNIPINIIIKKLSGINVGVSLPMIAAIILVLISIVLTLIAGLIPSHLAAKKDPVIALRTE